jgi:hypothetical protein
MSELKAEWDISSLTPILCHAQERFRKPVQILSLAALCSTLTVLAPRGAGLYRFALEKELLFFSPVFTPGCVAETHGHSINRDLPDQMSAAR